MTKLKAQIILGVILLAIAALAVLSYEPRIRTKQDLDSFAQCLAGKQITMYGADWCSHCQNEKKAFGDSFRLVPYVECPREPERCLAAGVTGYPTWIFPDGKKLVGEQGVERLVKESGCALDGTSTPIPPVSSLHSESVVLPVSWGDTGAKLVSIGAIDAGAFRALYQTRGVWTPAYEQLLSGNDNGALEITRENAGVLLNFLWALGLASKNPVLEKGSMQNPAYGGAGNFASTGGWTLAQGDAMSHYSRHLFFTLTPEQQALVEKIAKGIYRPCCDNSTHFPDCNHGMAMLGLLELMASQGVPEEDMWRAALAVNSFWFPDTYKTIAAYKQQQGVHWEAVSPQEVLGAAFSSASGSRKIAAQVTMPLPQGSGSGCGVSVPAVPTPKPSGGCGVGSPPTAIPQKSQSGGCGV